ncbi:MAG: ATP-binding cassette domain-containing protein, partial [Spirillospora sp.]
ARLDEVIERLPGGWAANVGEGGALLSGGERQRVSIARALLKNAPIVLLDEVTSALDPINEAAVHEGIERLMAGRTVIMVAHRMRTVQRADQIAFLDNGKIVEKGTHNDLLRDTGRYAAFWNLSLTG